MKKKNYLLLSVNHLFILILCIASFSMPIQAQSDKISKNAHRFYLEKLAPPVAFEGAKDKAKWGIYFWEFGDGNYSMAYDNIPVDSYYRSTENRTVNVFLTPFYAKSKPKRISQEIPKVVINRYKKSDGNEIEDNTLVNLISNSNQQVIADHDIRMALHYKASPTNATDGTLLVFFNNNAEQRGEEDSLRIDFDPFLIPEPRIEGKEDDFFDAYKHPVSLIDYEEFQTYYKGRGTLATKIKEFYRTHNDVLAFKVSDALKAGEERRLFLSLQGNPELHQVQDRNGADYGITTVWVPNKGVYITKQVIKEFKFAATSVHDPNRISVRPKTAYFRKKFGKRLTYRVDFQNVGKDPVKDSMKIRVDFPNETVDLASLRLKDSEYENGGEATCPEGYRYDPNSLFNCIKIDTSHSQKQHHALFTLYGILLSGKKDRSLKKRKKSSKSFIEFSVKSTDKKLGKSRAKALIMFTDKERVETNTARTKWKHRSIGLKIGHHFIMNTEDFTTPDLSWKDQISAGIYFQNAPMRTGFFRRFELEYRTLVYERDTTLVSINPDGTPLNSFSQLENNKMQLLDVNGVIGYQLQGLVNFSLGGGFSLPLWARTKLKTQYIQNNFTLEEETLVNFGILNNEEPTEFFNQEIDKNPFFGLNWKLGMEFGSLNNIAFGLNQNNYYYPKAVTGKCLKAHTLEAYIRFKLTPLFSKN